MDSFPSQEDDLSGFDNTLCRIVDLSIEMDKLTPTEKWEAQREPFDQEDYAQMVLARNIPMTAGTRDKLLRSHGHKVVLNMYLLNALFIISFSHRRKKDPRRIFRPTPASHQPQRIQVGLRLPYPQLVKRSLEIPRRRGYDFLQRN